jgi:hypothetical protein
VITDLASYGEWNPFVVACRSSLEVGTPIDMRVRLVGSFVQSQREFIFEHEPGRTLAYGVAPMALGLMASRRSHEVTPVDEGRSRYRSHFELSGRLAPVIRGLLGGRLQAGFHGMTQGIATRAEELHSNAVS